MYDNPAYLMLLGVSIGLVFSGASNGTLPALLQAIGGLLAVSGGGMLLGEAYGRSRDTE
ncbi:hypothetical protein [Halorubrum halodurans]|uniref:hypothetical protein n=1 Tax=Halorubrum halodurans TaxID=1383851 RepID=UPI0015C68EE4|nr:hypothetical protein [Halorubrum halodurans]